MQAVLPHMLANVQRDRQCRQHGAPRGRPGSSIHYAASKGAVVTMTMGVARSLPHRVSAPVNLAGQKHRSGRAGPPLNWQRVLDDVPMKRFMSRRDRGTRAVMCSDACPFMTDTVYVNSGGGWRDRLAPVFLDDNRLGTDVPWPQLSVMAVVCAIEIPLCCCEKPI